MNVSNRMRIGQSLMAGFAFLVICLGNGSAVFGQVIIATFTPTGTADYSYTGGTNQSTLTTTPSPLGGTVSYGSTFYNGTNLSGTLTLNNVSSSTAAVEVTSSPFFGYQQGWSGSYTITQGSNILTVSFTNATLAVTGGAPTLSGNATISANFGNPLGQPESFSLALSGANPTVGMGSFGFTNFTANDDNTASAVITAVPEPSAMAIAGLGALGFIGYGLRRRKALGA
jgi:hypothetical protein